MRYLCIALRQKKRKLKLNKLNKISGLSRWKAKATEGLSVSISWGWGGEGGPPGHQWVVGGACGQRQEAEVRARRHDSHDPLLP